MLSGAEADCCPPLGGGIPSEFDEWDPCDHCISGGDCQCPSCCHDELPASRCGRGFQLGAPQAGPQVIGTRGPDLPSGGDNYRFWWRCHTNDPASNLQDSNPAIAAPLLLWLSTVRCTIDLATKANPCLQIEDTSKNSEEHNLKIADELLKHSSWGLTNRTSGETDKAD